MAKVFDGQNGNGQSSPVDVPNDKVQIYLASDIGGGTVQLQKRDPAGNWENVENASWTAIGFKHVDAGPGKYRLDLSGTGGNSGLDAWIIENEAEARRLAGI